MKMDDKEEQLNSFEQSETKDQLKPKRPSKTLKKHLRYMKKLEFYKNKKIEKKLEKKDKKENDNLEPLESETSQNKTRINKQSRQFRQNIRQKLNNVYESDELKAQSLKVLLDCSFCSIMSEKEQSRLAQQIGQCYASNKAATHPAYFKLVNLKNDTFFYKELCRVNDGFERYVIEKSDRTLQEDYPTELHKLVYLTPDSQNILETLDKDNKIYVLGGLVDETVSKKVTYDKCENLKISTVRLPIEEYMSRQKNNSKFNFSKVLSINQVFGILLEFSESNDWKLALGHGVPKRKGYFVENIPQNNDIATSTENSEPQANDYV